MGWGTSGTGMVMGTGDKEMRQRRLVIVCKYEPTVDLLLCVPQGEGRTA